MARSRRGVRCRLIKEPGGLRSFSDRALAAVPLKEHHHDDASEEQVLLVFG
jgi:hypothetical protein